MRNYFELEYNALMGELLTGNCSRIVTCGNAGIQAIMYKRGITDIEMFYGIVMKELL